MTSVVLVEFVTPGRFLGGWIFPFLKGLCRQHGCQVHRLRYGLAPDVQFRRDEHGIGLDESDEQGLAVSLRELGATHVVLGAPPAPGLWRALRAAVPQATFAEAGLEPAERREAGEQAWGRFPRWHAPGAPQTASGRR